MKTMRTLLLAFRLRVVCALALTISALLCLTQPAAAENGQAGSAGRAYVLDFEPTANLTSLEIAHDYGTEPAVNGLGATARMTFQVVNGKTQVWVEVRGARPNTVYTIWSVYNRLMWPLCYQLGANNQCGNSTGPGSPKASPPSPSFPQEANGVAPLGPLDEGYTSGMELDPGATVVTDRHGNGRVYVKLDYDLVATDDNGPPLANKNIIIQCVPGPLIDGKCLTTDPTGQPLPNKTMRVTTTWLRTYVYQIRNAGQDPATMCANYDGSPQSQYWQCVDPATVDPKTGAGLPRVFRFAFDHFRLAAHPDGLTHGFIGGSEQEHVIDMVGRRSQLTTRGQ